MNAVTPVTITLPDGRECNLRFTLGARKRIQERFGMSMKDALNKLDSGALPGILWALMHDSEGQPPEITENWLAENLPAESASELMAAVLSAGSQGRISKNDLRVRIEDQLMKELTSTGSNSGDSAPNSLDSPIESSGGDTLNARSSHALNGSI